MHAHVHRKAIVFACIMNTGVRGYLSTCKGNTSLNLKASPRHWHTHISSFTHAENIAVSEFIGRYFRYYAFRNESTKNHRAYLFNSLTPTLTHAHTVKSWTSGVIMGDNLSGSRGAVSMTVPLRQHGLNSLFAACWFLMWPNVTSTGHACCMCVSIINGHFVWFFM